MLHKKRRIAKQLFNKNPNKGLFFNSPHISLRILKNDGEKESRFSFSVSKKVAKIAVMRNLLRRRGYAVLRKEWDGISHPFLGFFTLKKGAENLSYEKYKEEILFLLVKSNLLKNNSFFVDKTK